MNSFTLNEIEEYTKAHTSEESAVLKELRSIALKRLGLPDMICGPQVGQFLKTLVAIGNCRRVLEVGTFIGYSSIMMADAMGSGELITLEIEEKYADISRPYFEQMDYRNIICQKMGPAIDTIDTLQASFDLIFVDADKLSYPDYYKKTLPLLRKNGVMVFDNALWNGEVLQPDTPEAKVIFELNRLVHEDTDVSNVLLPLRDGLMVVVKTG
jgi:caffeoyl-CoA O-methyltransferase